jgi:hypothetical protein
MWLLAEDLLLLCWEDQDGRPHPACAPTLAGGVGGARLLEAHHAGLVDFDGERVRRTAATAEEPLLAEVVAAARSHRRPPQIEAVVERLGAWDRLAKVRRRLVDAGVLHRQHHRVLGLIPDTRCPLADAARAAEARQAVAAVLTGQRLAAPAASHWVRLAALAEPTRAINRLLAPADRAGAYQRAKALADAGGVPERLTDAIRNSYTVVAIP